MTLINIIRTTYNLSSIYWIYKSYRKFRDPRTPFIYGYGKSIEWDDLNLSWWSDV